MSLVNRLAYFLGGGMVVSGLYHLRFESDILRREMLLSMKSSNSGYFLMFLIIDGLALGLLFLIHTIYKWRKTKKPTDKQGND